MWELKNRTPYAVERTWIRDKRGAHQWVVAVKATFVAASDASLRLADEQLPPLLAPEYTGEPGRSAVRYEADLGPAKSTTDILLVGSAHAPGGRPATQVAVSLRAEDLQKELVVFGERGYIDAPAGPSISSAQPFVTRAISYEVAFGGTDTTDPDPGKHAMDTRNPIGRGFALRPSRLAGRPAPCIQYPGSDLARAGPAGFGPIASYWSPRLELWGTYDEAWQRSKRPLLPDDFDERVALCAPVDQRPARHLRGGEPFEIRNMTPPGLWRFQLPKIYLTFTTYFGARTEEHRSHLATVLVEPDEQRVQMVWQTNLPVRADRAEYLDKTVIDQKAYLS